jgi:hypothetical protein
MRRQLASRELQLQLWHSYDIAQAIFGKSWVIYDAVKHLSPEIKQAASALYSEACQLRDDTVIYRNSFAMPAIHPKDWDKYGHNPR